MTEWKKTDIELPFYRNFKCLVYDGNAVMYAIYDNNYSLFSNAEYGILKNITHWAELPEAPDE